MLASMGFKVMPNVPGEDQIGGRWSEQVRCSFNIPAPWRTGWHMRAQAGNSMDTEDIFKVLLYSFTDVTIHAKSVPKISRPLFSSAFALTFTPDPHAVQHGQAVKVKASGVRRRCCGKTRPEPEGSKDTV